MLATMTLHLFFSSVIVIFNSIVDISYLFISYMAGWLLLRAVVDIQNAVGYFYP